MNRRHYVPDNKITKSKTGLLTRYAKTTRREKASEREMKHREAPGNRPGRTSGRGKTNQEIRERERHVRSKQLALDFQNRCIARDYRPRLPLTAWEGCRTVTNVP